MPMTLALAGLMMAQVASPEITVESRASHSDVGYEELMQGRPRAAIETIRRNGAEKSADPVAMINLGTATAMLGKKTEAIRFYQASINSQDRYDVELSNGQWMDSRMAARLALKQLASK